MGFFVPRCGAGALALARGGGIDVVGQHRGSIPRMRALAGGDAITLGRPSVPGNRPGAGQLTVRSLFGRTSSAPFCATSARARSTAWT